MKRSGCFPQLQNLMPRCVADNKGSITGTLAMGVRNSHKRRFLKRVWQSVNNRQRTRNVLNFEDKKILTIAFIEGQLRFSNSFIDSKTQLHIFLIWERPGKILKWNNKVSSIFCDHGSDFSLSNELVIILSLCLCFRQLLSISSNETLGWYYGM